MPSDGKVHPEHHGLQRRVLSGDCESLTLPTSDGVYGVQAGHNPVLVALHMGLMHFTVNGEEHEVLVGDGIVIELFVCDVQRFIRDMFQDVSCLLYTSDAPRDEKESAIVLADLVMEK